MTKTPREVLAIIIGSLLAACMVLLLIIGGWAVISGAGRWQARANANNRVSISAIEIRNQAQRIKVAQQRAEIRRQDAIGIREAQDEIAKTLTPLYVQFEMVDALRRIAQSGHNNSVVYIPAGSNGVPLVSDISQGKVGPPDQNQ